MLWSILPSLSRGSSLVIRQPTAVTWHLMLSFLVFVRLLRAPQR
jgi:hypothetical protein